MNLETSNERKTSVNEASPATSKLFSAIPTDKGTAIEEEEGDSTSTEDDVDGDEGDSSDEKDLNLVKPAIETTGDPDENDEDEDEEVGDEVDEDEGEDSEIVSGLYEAFGEVELETTDFDNEVEATKAYVTALAKKEHEKGKSEAITELFEVFPEAKQLVEHLNSGYTVESFMKEVQVPDYSKVNLEEASDDEKERLLRTYLRERGDDEEDIEDAIEVAKDTDKLDSRASKAQKWLVDKHKKEVEEQKQREAEKTKAHQEAVEKQNQQIKEILSSGNLGVATLDKNQVKELSEHLSRKDRAEVWKNLSLEKQLLLEYLAATDFKDLNFGKKEVQKRVAQAIKIKKSKSSKSGLSSGTPKINLKNFNNAKK